MGTKGAWGAGFGQGAQGGRLLAAPPCSVKWAGAGIPGGSVRAQAGPTATAQHRGHRGRGREPRAWGV